MKLSDKYFLVPFLLLVIIVALTLILSCTISLKDKGSVYIEFSQGIRVGHETSKTTGTETEAKIDGKSLVNHILDLRKDDEEITTIQPTTQPTN